MSVQNYVMLARLCSSVVRSAFGRALCGVRLMLVRVAFVRGGSQGEAECGELWTTERPQQDMGTGAPRQAADLPRAHHGLVTDFTRTRLRACYGLLTDGLRACYGLLTDGLRAIHGRVTDKRRTGKGYESVTSPSHPSSHHIFESGLPSGRPPIRFLLKTAQTRRVTSDSRALRGSSPW